MIKQINYIHFIAFLLLKAKILEDKALTKEFLFVTHKYPPSTGGMQKQSFELINHVRKVRGIHTIIYRGNYPKFIFLMISTPWVWIKILRNKNIGLVHANDGLMALFLTPLLCTRKIKICATVHGLDVVFNIPFYQWWIRNFLSRFDLIITVSEGTKEECLKRFIPQQKIVFIPNGFEFPAQEVNSKKPDTSKNKLGDAIILLSVGRPVPRKGFSWFVKNVLPHIEHQCKYVLVGPKLNNERSIALFQRYLPNWLFRKYCILNGVPLDYIELQKLSNQKHGKSSVLLAGQLSQAELDNLYDEADLFLMPNISVRGDYEGFGLVTLEAASRSLLCIASNVDGIPSAIQDKETGLLLEPENGEVWALQINKLIKEETYQSLGKSFSNNLLAKNHSWESMSIAYLEAFKAISI